MGGAQAPQAMTCPRVRPSQNIGTNITHQQQHSRNNINIMQADTAAKVL
jgi:hypothetical protein